jgi:hypothetical protein
MKLSSVRDMLSRMTPNPWRRLADEWPAVRVEHVDLGERWECTRWESAGPVIYLHEDLLQVQRRYAIAHACEHLDRGAPCRTLRAAIEARVVTATAKWLLPDLDKIVDVLSCYDLRAAASELWVPWGCLVDRLNNLSDAESLYVHQRRGDAVA